MGYRQVDCFKMNMKYWKFLGIWPGNKCDSYKIYSRCFVFFFIFIYDVFPTVNFFYLDGQMDTFIEELIFYFTETCVLVKVTTFLILKDKIIQLFVILESDIFQPENERGSKIVEKAKKFITRYWIVTAIVSYFSNVTHVTSPMVAHIFSGTELFLPVCSYSFLPESFKQTFINPIYIYQSVGMHFQMLNNVNIDTFILGVIILAIAQLDVLDDKLRRLTDNGVNGTNISTEQDKNQHETASFSMRSGRDTHLSPRLDSNFIMPQRRNDTIDEETVYKFNKCILHFDEIFQFIELFQEIFSIVLFLQFSQASIVICVCLFRFTLPAPKEYYCFLFTYMFIMVIQIMVPCWFGTRVIDKSENLSKAVYHCDWTVRSRRFKSNLRFFVQRVSKPITIVGWKMFPLSLVTFSSIINSSYSFFTLLRHMQSRQIEK